LLAGVANAGGFAACSEDKPEKAGQAKEKEAVPGFVN
jgi:hypothetical protein